MSGLLRRLLLLVFLAVLGSSVIYTLFYYNTTETVQPITFRYFLETLSSFNFSFSSIFESLPQLQELMDSFSGATMEWWNVLNWLEVIFNTIHLAIEFVLVLIKDIISAMSSLLTLLSRLWFVPVG